MENPTQKITKQQREYLRKAAHELKPLVQIGKQGVTDTVRSAVDVALTAHELIKVKFVASKEEKWELVEKLTAATGSEAVTIIGNVAILFRRHPDPAKRNIELPD